MTQRSQLDVSAILHLTTRSRRWPQLTMCHSCWSTLIFGLAMALLQTGRSAATSSGGRQQLGGNHPGAVSSAKEATEYCELESFQPRCSSDHVIKVTLAQYGLMSLGRCLAADYGYIGCFTDVIDYVSARCSGRRFCRQDVPDKYLSTAATACRREFKSYLSAAYECIPVVSASTCRSCNADGHVRVNAGGLNDTGGYIASILTTERQDDNGCGGPRCPWIIEALPGQVINLTLFEYNPQHVTDASQGSTNQRSSGSRSDPCSGSRFFIIKERANPRDVSVCGSSGGHVTGRHVFTSVSNHVELQIVSAEALSQKMQFVVHYEAVGCADVIPPTNGWSRRIEGRMELGCASTGRQWSLTCVGNKWIGDLGATCVSSSRSSTSSFDVGHIVDRMSSWIQQIIDYANSVPLGILVTTVASVGLVLLVIIATCCFVCIKRSRYRTQYQSATITSNRVVGQRGNVAPEAEQSCASGAYYGDKMFYQQQQQLMSANTPMTCKLHNPDWTTSTVDESSEDTNKYVCGGAGRAGPPPPDNRPLPSLPRRQDNESNFNRGCFVGSLVSNASGSDASLHWDDSSSRPETATAAVPATAGLQQQQLARMSAGPVANGSVSSRQSRNSAVASQESDYLTPRTLTSNEPSPLSTSQNQRGTGMQETAPTFVDQNSLRQWQLEQQQLLQQRHWRQHPQLMARASFPVAMATDGQPAPWEIADPSHQTMPRLAHAAAGPEAQSNGVVSVGRPGGRLS